MKKINVVAAIITHNNKYLCLQRDKAKFDYISYKWEFPGGKIELNESDEAALKREIKEELDFDINVEHLIIEVNHQYPDFHITMNAYLCHADNMNFKLKEHINYQWLTKDELDILDWAAADLPIVNLSKNQK